MTALASVESAAARGAREFILQTGEGDGRVVVGAGPDGRVTECAPAAGAAAPMRAAEPFVAGVGRQDRHSQTQDHRSISERTKRQPARGQDRHPQTQDHRSSGALFSSLGLVDIQVNGFAGVDFNRTDTTAEAVDHALATMLAHGATRCLPTIITASVEAMAARLQALDAAVERSRLGSWMVMGYHLEGPFLSAEDGYAGCHPKAQMRAATFDILERLEHGLRRPVRLLTVAPEREGVLDLIPQAIAAGKTIAIGHTAATRAQIEAAAAAGARLSTHLGNGIGHLLEKNENPLFAQLGEDRLSASFIADGIHIPPYMLRLYIRAKGLSRTILITDATAGAAAAPGPYTLGDVLIEKSRDGIVREPGSPYLGGSSATMDAILRNAIAWLPATFNEALELARANPLRLLGEPNVPAAGGPLEYVTWRLARGGPEVVEAGVGPWVVKGGAPRVRITSNKSSIAGQSFFR